MLKRFISVLLLLYPSVVCAQSAFDSLKKVYHAQYVFEQREKGDSFKFVKAQISTIKNPELKQLAVCAIAENVYGFGFIDTKKLLALLDEVIAEPYSETVKTTALTVKAEITRSLVGSKIHDINLPGPGGQSGNLTDYYSSSFDYVVVDLWATWCGPCIAEMKKFNDLRKQYNVEFYSISLDDDITKVQKFIKRNPHYTWPIVFAGKGSPLWDYFKARQIPAFVIVDKNGIIISHIVGKGLEEELRKLYKK